MYLLNTLKLTYKTPSLDSIEKYLMLEPGRSAKGEFQIWGATTEKALSLVTTDLAPNQW